MEAPQPEITQPKAKRSNKAGAGRPKGANTRNIEARFLAKQAKFVAQKERLESKLAVVKRADYEHNKKTLERLTKAIEVIEHAVQSYESCLDSMASEVLESVS